MLHNDKKRNQLSVRGIAKRIIEYQGKKIVFKLTPANVEQPKKSAKRVACSLRVYQRVK